MTDRQARAKLLEQILRLSIPLQIRVLRLERSWTQADLARKTGMAQSRISALECCPLVGPLPTIKTLQKIAKACDVALLVGFSSWSELVASMANDHSLPIPSFDPQS